MAAKWTLMEADWQMLSQRHFGRWKNLVSFSSFSPLLRDNKLRFHSELLNNFKSRSSACLMLIIKFQEGYLFLHLAQRILDFFLISMKLIWVWGAEFSLLELLKSFANDWLLSSWRLAEIASVWQFFYWGSLRTQTVFCP